MASRPRPYEKAAAGHRSFYGAGRVAAGRVDGYGADEVTASARALQTFVHEPARQASYTLDVIGLRRAGLHIQRSEARYATIGVGRSGGYAYRLQCNRLQPLR